jgi:hypothetical protein
MRKSPDCQEFSVQNRNDVILATAIFLENHSSVLWWENPYVWLFLIAGALVFVEWYWRRFRYG